MEATTPVKPVGETPELPGLPCCVPWTVMPPSGGAEKDRGARRVRAEEGRRLRRERTDGDTEEAGERCAKDKVVVRVFAQGRLDQGCRDSCRWHGSSANARVREAGHLVGHALRGVIGPAVLRLVHVVVTVLRAILIPVAFV